MHPKLIPASPDGAMIASVLADRRARRLRLARCATPLVAIAIALLCGMKDPGRR